MPVAVALLCHPAASYGLLLIAIAGLTYGIHTRRFLPTFTGISAGLLATLAFLQVPPDDSALPLLAIGVALLHVEFRLPTSGAAGAIGLATSLSASWLLLSPALTAHSVSVPLRVALALVGTAALGWVIGRATRSGATRTERNPSARGDE